MTISIIVATDKNGCIGKNNTLPFSSKKDMAHFKNMTTGKDIIMGSKTWDSLPFKPLPNRKNIIITRADLRYFDTSNENIVHVNSLEHALNISKDPFIIGGGQIYTEAEKYADIIYLTIFPDIEVENGDTFFKLNYKWTTVDIKDDIENDMRIKFTTLKRVP